MLERGMLPTGIRVTVTPDQVFLMGRPVSERPGTVKDDLSWPLFEALDPLVHDAPDIPPPPGHREVRFAWLDVAATETWRDVGPLVRAIAGADVMGLTLAATDTQGTPATRTIWMRGEPHPSVGTRRAPEGEPFGPTRLVSLLLQEEPQQSRVNVRLGASGFELSGRSVQVEKANGVPELLAVLPAEGAGRYVVAYPGSETTMQQLVDLADAIQDTGATFEVAMAPWE